MCGWWNFQCVLRRLQARAPYRGINKLPAEPVVMIYLKTGEVAGEDDFIEKIDARVREFQDDEEIKHMMSVEDEMRLVYERKLERELKEGLEKGLEQAKKQGLEQGLKQGLEQGIELKAQEMARALKDRGISIEIIAETSGLSREEIDKL